MFSDFENICVISNGNLKIVFVDLTFQPPDEYEGAKIYQYKHTTFFIKEFDTGYDTPGDTQADDVETHYCKLG